MATRDDRLRELGLWPRWTRRGESAAAAPPAVDVPDGAGGASREARIAGLGWESLAADVDACTACGLCRTRQRSVPGVGDGAADWLFVGEAPGAEEDAQGEPFVGQAGRLLDSMLAALQLARGRNVYIANVLKCRPPNNRTPTPGEVAACRPYLDRQVALIAPKIIVALGKSAANTLLDNEATIGSLRGRVHAYRGVPLVVTYHPAYLLRTLQDKAKAWEDLVLARRTLQAATVATSVTATVAGSGP
ncbi:MAG: uracil-DNA glycosylase [Betaproteobacteria bacterium]|nr:uracil-DNA glycosylase [Betaproteobacteria bacterium]MBK7082760.1 uracil-DNA glycosylase [Betaproteobacteria bacterium]MBK7591805.1 uracil-DNA glycosylase [Betaproteobacteria bacterium]MBK7745505.1 uracil-DNA glycosylase [Betaproteobacteria bacterium]MBK8690305.1 uracil-DNA glycosylase [Betaproteobacteria bacterium]